MDEKLCSEISKMFPSLWLVQMSCLFGVNAQNSYQILRIRPQLWNMWLRPVELKALQWKCESVGGIVTDDRGAFVIFATKVVFLFCFFDSLCYIIILY